MAWLDPFRPYSLNVREKVATTCHASTKTGILRQRYWLVPATGFLTWIARLDSETSWPKRCDLGRQNRPYYCGADENVDLVGAVALGISRNTVRILLGARLDSISHFALRSNHTSDTVAHRTLEEIWHVFQGWERNVGARKAIENESFRLVGVSCRSLSGAVLSLAPSRHEALVVIRTQSWPRAGEWLQVEERTKSRGNRRGCSPRPPDPRWRRTA
jgi:hypothetical protein